MNSNNLPQRNKPDNHPDDPKKDEKEKQELRRRQLRFSISYLIASLIGLWLFQQFILSPLMVNQIEIPYSEFKSKLKSGDIVEVTLGTDRINGTMKDTSAQATPGATVPFTTVAVPNGDPTLIQDLDAAGVKYSVTEPASPIGAFLLSYGLPLLLIGAIWYFGYRQIARAGMGGGMGGIMSVGKSRATEVKPEAIGVTYKDVGGADEAIAELQEIIQFLKSPEKFSDLGGRIPKGVLLVGPPGTGKTLLARAVAG
jgi:cell division protease FtsH